MSGVDDSTKNDKFHNFNFSTLFFMNNLPKRPSFVSDRGKSQKMEKIFDLRNFDFLQKFLCPGLMILQKMTNFIISTFGRIINPGHRNFCKKSKFLKSSIFFKN